MWRFKVNVQGISMVLVSNSSIFTLIWGRFPFWLHNMFQWGWNHQLDLNWLYDYITYMTIHTRVFLSTTADLCFWKSSCRVSKTRNAWRIHVWYTYMRLTCHSKHGHTCGSSRVPPQCSPVQAIRSYNPAPVDMENIPFSHRFIDNRWCRISSINSIKGLFSTIIP